MYIVVVAVVVAAGAGYWLQLDDMRRIATVMVALFGVLTGFLVNAMIRTATALEGTLTLTPTELRQISSALKMQQSGWKRLFHLYIAVIVLTIVFSIVPVHWTITLRGRSYDLSVLGIALFFAFVTIVLARTLTVVDGVSALQDLRSKLLIAAAEKREREERRRAVNEVVFEPGPADPDFGRKIAFPSGPPP
jgi:hypothetical protein